MLPYKQYTNRYVCIGSWTHTHRRAQNTKALYPSEIFILCSQVPINGLVLSASLSLFLLFFKFMLVLYLWLTPSSLSKQSSSSLFPILTPFFFFFFKFPLSFPCQLFTFHLPFHHYRPPSLLCLSLFPFLQVFTSVFKLFDLPLCISLLPLLPVLVVRNPSVSFSLSLCPTPSPSLPLSLPC